MRFKGEEAPEQRFTGTIVDIEDRDPHKCPESKWKCLKVRWDKTSTIPRPDRVFGGTPPLDIPALSGTLGETQAAPKGLMRACGRSMSDGDCKTIIKGIE
nr:auxin response factor 2-like isoform X1 [Ipomoea trifida]